MATNNHTSPWAERMLELVEKKPRSREWLVGAVQGLVPPGRAWRVREHMREWETAQRGSNFVPDTPDDDKIRVGARRVVNSSLVRLIQIGRFEQFEQDGQRWIRFGRPPMDYWTPERRAERAESSRRHWASMTPEQRTAYMKHASESLTPEQRSASSRKGWATRRAQKNGQ